MAPTLKLVSRDSGPRIYPSAEVNSTTLGSPATHPPYLDLCKGETVQTTCSDGRCPQPVSLDRGAERRGLCYFHAKVEDGLIVDFYEGPTYDDEGHLLVVGELVPVVLP